MPLEDGHVELAVGQLVGHREPCYTTAEDEDSVHRCAPQPGVRSQKVSQPGEPAEALSSGTWAVQSISVPSSAGCTSPAASSSPTHGISVARAFSQGSAFRRWRRPAPDSRGHKEGRTTTSLLTWR